MAYRTVNVKPETYERLASYKVPGLTFDALVGLLLDGASPDEIRARYVEQLAAPPEPAAEDPVEKLVEFRAPKSVSKRRNLLRKG
ncbi:MAG: hypothetical protein ACPHID_01430 [Thermoplasmatota archaeon]